MKKSKFIILILLLSILTVFLAVSVAVFNYLGNGTTNNVIQTGRIVFSYSDAELGAGGDGIEIVNAYPIPDSQGKLLASPNEYFDFNVTASTTNTDLAYEIVVNKNEESTLEEERVKIYLTEFNGNNEVETEITGGNNVPTYSELKDTTNTLLKGKSIYFGTVKAGEVAYGKSFRLRMWLKNENLAASDQEVTLEKEFRVRVNVAAIGNN